VFSIIFCKEIFRLVGGSISSVTQRFINELYHLMGMTSPNVVPLGETTKHSCTTTGYLHINDKTDGLIAMLEIYWTYWRRDSGQSFLLPGVAHSAQVLRALMRTM
jgi:hypothetical protein